MNQKMSVSWNRVVHATVSHGVIVILLMSVVLNIVLSRELRASKVTRPSGPAAGAAVPPIVGTTPDGVRTTVSYDIDRPTLIYYFRSDCGWCERNWDNLSALATHAGSSYRVVAISGSSGRPVRLRDLGASGLSAEVIELGDVGQATLEAYQFVATPHTMVVSREGRVVRSWTGAYQGSRLREVSGFFGVQLPGLRSRERARRTP